MLIVCSVPPHGGPSFSFVPILFPFALFNHGGGGGGREFRGKFRDRGLFLQPEIGEEGDEWKSKRVGFDFV